MSGASPLKLHLPTVTSTQDAARGLPVGSRVSADYQESGRGRLGRSWQAPPGTALMVSYVVPWHPVASLAAGVAAAAAIGPPVRLKWPNDLILGGAKLGGILVEVSDRVCTVGIGVNLSAAPPGAARLLPGEPPPETVRALRDRLLEEIEAGLMELIEASPAQVVERWRQLSDTLGRRVRLVIPGESVEGVAEAITDDGAIVIGGVAYSVGEIVMLRSLDQ